MKFTLLVLVTALTAPLSRSAAADEAHCPSSMAQQSMSIEAAISKAETLGYAVRKAKRSQGCWKIDGYDGNGAEIEFILDSQSGEIVKPPRWRPPVSAAR